MLHGVLLIALFACAAFYIGDIDWMKTLSFSPMAVGIIIGMLYADSLRNNQLDTFLLTMTMAVLGAETSFDKFKKAGFTPFLLAAIFYCWLIGDGYCLVKFSIPYL